jgi:PAS domain-containing protein
VKNLIQFYALYPGPNRPLEPVTCMRIVLNAKIALQRKIAWLLFFSFFSLCFGGWLIYFNMTDKRIAFALIGGNALMFAFIFIILVRLNQDIELRKQAEGRLKENQAWLQSILDNTTSLIYIKDPE